MSTRRAPGLPPTVKSILANTTKRGECRLWVGSTSANGYPYIYDCRQYSRGEASGQSVNGMRSARLLLWELGNGPLPAGKARVVMTCMNKLCLAREHMVPMSRADAAAYAAMHGSYKTVRHRMASRANARKGAIIDAEKAAQVRHRVLVEKEDRKAVAADFGVTRSYIDQIMRGARWKPPQVALNASVFHQLPERLAA